MITHQAVGYNCEHVVCEAREVGPAVTRSEHEHQLTGWSCLSPSAPPRQRHQPSLAGPLRASWEIRRKILIEISPSHLQSKESLIPLEDSHQEKRDWRLPSATQELRLQKFVSLWAVAVAVPPPRQQQQQHLIHDKAAHITELTLNTQP